MSKTEPLPEWSEKTRAESVAEYSIPRHCTLDGFAREASRRGGLEITQLSPLTRVQVRTHNSFYQITLLDPGEATAIVQGGRFFTEPTKVYLCGSSYGGTLLKMAWIIFGMRMELLANGRRIVTSPVVTIETPDDDSLPGPF